jgi:hypothetical protein
MSVMNKRTKLVLAAGGAAVALLGLGAAGAVGASTLLSPDEERTAIIDDAAEQLGVEPEALSDALKQALKNRIDEAVEGGRLTEAQGDELKERIDADEYPLLPGFGWKFGGGPGLDFGVHVGPIDLVETAATYLGLSGAALREALQDKTLAEVARDRGKSLSGLVEALVAPKIERIDEAVDAGRITQEQASELKAMLREHTEALVNGERPERRKFHGPGAWGGSWSRAPPVLRGPFA